MNSVHVTIPADTLTSLCQKYHIKELSIFGSAIRDDFRDDSDVDVLVEFEPEARIGFLALAQLQRELSAIVQRPVDIVPKNGLKPHIRVAVLASAQVLYAA